MSQASHPQRLLSVQVLRGVAVMLVVFFHIYELQRLALSAPGAGSNVARDLEAIAGPWMRGYAGVDLFFVISGFIMVFITAHVQPHWREPLVFLKKRAIRIYPLWWIFCGLLMAYYMAVNGRPLSPDAIGAQTQTLPYLLKSAFLIPQADYPILGVGWTLIHEVFFYIVFAGLLLLTFWLRIAALIVWAVIIVFALSQGWVSAPAKTYGALSLSVLTLEFIAGAVAGALIVRRRIFAPAVFLALGVISSGLALFLYTESNFDTVSIGRVMVFTLPFAFMIYGAAGLEIKNEPKLTRPGFRLWVWLGDISYSLYLSHLLVLGILMRSLSLLPGPALGSAGLLDNALFVGLGLAASILSAALFYYGAERPLLRMMRRRKQTGER